MTCLVHLASGVGNIVLATPLLVALAELGWTIDVCLDADYAGTADLLRPWSVVREVFPGSETTVRARAGYDTVIVAVPPFYWGKYGRRWSTAGSRLVPRPPDVEFSRDEQAYYMWFARRLGYLGGHRPACQLPIGPRADEERVTLDTVVLAPGCKTGSMAAKRWPHFAELAERFDDVAVVGTPDDLTRHDKRPIRFPSHVRSFVGTVSLRETAELMAGAGVVVANDAGLGHVAGAVGVPTLILFGPTSEHCLGALPANVRVLRAGLPCEPCWSSAPLAACAGRVACLDTLSVSRVEQEVRHWVGAPPDERLPTTRTMEVA